MHRFEEIAWVDTEMGELTLRRRHEPSVDAEVFEVKLGDEYLMSSLFTVAEEELSRLGLAALAPEMHGLDVLVGGLGLGYTAIAALRDDRVRSLTVVDALPAVIAWHRAGLLPVSPSLISDPRTSLVHADFFALMRGEPGAHAELPEKVHAILLDVDHTPSFPLDVSHTSLYTVDGLRSLARHLHPGGVFALWSDDEPDEAFLTVLQVVFSHVEGHTVPFANPITQGVSTNGVYVARDVRPV